MKSWTATFNDQATRFSFDDLNGKRQSRMPIEGRVLWLVDARVARLHSVRVKNIINQHESLGRPILLNVRESIKSLRQYEALCNVAANRGLKRTDTIGIIGGGALSDLGGFLAATWMRGIEWVVYPTTLLAMVDASIGGKTAVNVKQGKNLVGAIWQPRAICIDTGFLATLPARELRSGMGEVIKYAGLIGGTFLKTVSEWSHSHRSKKKPNEASLILSCVRHKSMVVMRDERENGVRMFLNLGHTFAHAIESSLGYDYLTHGEAVLIGLLAANRLSIRLACSSEQRITAYDKLVMQHAKQLRVPELNISTIIRRMGSDKKSGKSGLRFVLLERPGKPIIRGQVPLGIVRESLLQTLDDLNRR